MKRNEVRCGLGFSGKGGAIRDHEPMREQPLDEFGTSVRWPSGKADEMARLAATAEWRPITLHLSNNVTKSDTGSGFAEGEELSRGISEAIIAGGVLLFLTSLMVCGIVLAFTAYVKTPVKEKYVVQSGFIEIKP